MTTPTDPARYAGADLRLAAIDMDGTLLDNDKNFPPGMDELLDLMDERGVTFAPASGRQVWTLIDMFPGRPGMTVIGENGGIVMRDAIEAGTSDDAIVKLAVYAIGPVGALAEATLAHFADTHQYAISGANWADLQIRGVDKGSAVRDLQRFLGVDRSQTAVFGDAGNDLSMMSEGDLSFAMANASQDVIEAARFVAPSNNEAGVAQVLRALLG